MPRPCATTCSRSSGACEPPPSDRTEPEDAPGGRRPLLALAGAKGAWTLAAAGATGSGASLLIALGLLPAAIAAAVVASEDGSGPIGAAGIFVLVAGGGALVIAAVTGLAAVVGPGATSCRSWATKLHVRYGLLDHREHSMPRHRVQQVRIEATPLRRALGAAAAQVQSAALPGSELSGHIDIPWCREGALADLLEQAMGTTAWRPPPLQARPAAARRRAVVRRLAVTAVPIAVIASLSWPAGAGLLPLALLGLPWGLAAHRQAGSHLEGPILAVAVRRGRP